MGMQRAGPAGQRNPPKAGTDLADVLAAGVLVLVAAVAVAVLPDAAAVRIALVAPVLLVAPGYLLIQAFIVPAAPPHRRAVHAVIALGLSPVILGLAALATALVPGGFRTGPIVGAVTVACLGLAAVAVYRRLHVKDEEKPTAPRPVQPAPERDRPSAPAHGPFHR